MAEKIKRTHAERDALLSKVFDSTLQTKDIEITEAGTTEITPDEGFFALKKVNLNVNVQGGGGSVDSWVYYDFSSLGMSLSSDMLTSISAQFTLAKIRRSNGVIVIGNLYWIITNIETENYSSSQLVAVGTDEGIKCVNGDGTITVGEFYKLMGDPFAQFPRITKEEFYAM